jgi:hypothetical protein
MSENNTEVSTEATNSEDSQVLTGTTQSTEDWRSLLPEEIKSAKSLESIKTVEDLAKGYVNAQSLIGKRFEDMTPDQMDAYFNKKGRPEAPDGYGLEISDGMDKDLVDWFKQTAHKQGLPKEAAEGLFKEWNTRMEDLNTKMQAEQQLRQAEELKALKRDFGAAYDERVELANRALTEIGGDELVKAINDSGMGTSPALVKALAKVGMMLDEGRSVENTSSGRFGLSAEEATSKIMEKRKDPEFMAIYTNPSHSKHSVVKAELENLYKIRTSAS